MPVALFAVHVGEGVLSLPAIVIGFVLAGLLAALAAWRVREHEIPRIALMTAAFFVASSIHVKLGVSSVHLLLTGLVGVVLRGRAPLAILVGVTLQALLVGHGGLTSIGVNACTEMIPALAAAALFGLSARVGEQHRWFRWLLVGTTAVVWGWCLLFGLGLLGAIGLNWSEVIDWHSAGGLRVRLDSARGPALAFALHPLALLALGVFTAACVLLEVRRPSPAGFARGALVGTLAVLGTAALTGLVLLVGLQADEQVDSPDVWATAVFLPHVPLALVEGLIVGSTVAFLWRVKPEMLGQTPPLARAAAVVVLLGATATPAQAHGILIDRAIDRDKREVTITCRFDDGEIPKGAPVRIRGEDGTLLSEGKLDDAGRYTFRYDQPQALQVFVDAPGHPWREPITAAELGGEAPPAKGSRLQNLLAGVALLLAAAAFVMAWRNSVRISRLEAARNAPAAAEVKWRGERSEAVHRKTDEVTGG